MLRLNCLRKIVNKIISSLLLSACCTFLLQLHLCAQSNSGIQKMNRTVYLDGRIALDSLTRYVHRQTGIRFAFNSGIITGKNIRFSKGWYGEQSLLQHICKETGLTYRKLGKYIVFKKTVPVGKKEPDLTTRITKKDKGTSVVPVPVLNDSLQHRNITASPVKITLPSDTNIVSNTNAIVLPGWKRTISKLAARKRLAPDFGGNDKDRSGGFQLQGLHLRAGLSFSEMAYPELNVEAGWKRLHLIVNAGTNYKLFTPGLGMGSVLFRTENTEWQIYAGINFLKKDASLVIRDTMKNDFRINGKMYTGGISCSYYVNERWLIRAGVHFSLLHTTYSFKGKPATPAEIAGNQEPAEQQFRLWNSSFMLNRSFNQNSSSGSQSWIGCKLGLYFNFFSRE